jgi:hypothetical protein
MFPDMPQEIVGLNELIQVAQPLTQCLESSKHLNMSGYSYPFLATIINAY